MKNILYLITAGLLLFLSSCDKEDSLSPKSVLSVEDSYNGDLDKWISENFTEPYNIEVKWKWDDNEVANDFWVTPPQKEKAKQFLEAMLEIWIKPYAEETKGSGFLERFIPKIIMLVGTPQYNKDGTITLGLAEGGKKVTVFDIDKFDIKKRISVIRAFHTMHHEFSHILHQTVFYSPNFQNISKGDYTGNWKDVKVSDANNKGYITSYSMLNKDEDFVEIVAGITTTVDYSQTPKEYTVPFKNEKGEIEQIIDPATGKDRTKTINMKMTAWEYRLYMLGMTRRGVKYSQDPKSIEGSIKLKAKIQIVTSYFKTVWKVDLYSLQKRIDVATEALILKNK